MLPQSRMSLPPPTGPSLGALDPQPRGDSEGDADRGSGRVALVADAEREPLAPPPVVAVIVTRNPGDWLEETLAGLAAQDYPDLSVLVVDAGSDADPTARISAVLPDAYVRHVDGNVSFAAAANEALRAVTGAPFLLLCHDDAALDPPAVRLLVEEAFRSNAGIVGPKLVAAHDPEILLDVGQSIDRFGGAHTGIEPGELDQEQHDGVRDVFAVSSTVMLVRADLFSELGGFDPAAFPCESLDLCWRARLAGARVLVVPDARARHEEAADERPGHGSHDERYRAYGQARTAFVCFSGLSLVWIVPLAITFALLEAVAVLLTRRRTHAFAELGAWMANLAHPRRWLGARRRAQALRTIRDHDLHELQLGSTARFQSFLTQRHADERIQTLSDASRDLLERLGERLGHPASLAALAFLALVLFGSRDFFGAGPPAVGQFVRWPDVGTLAQSFGSAWRYTSLGSASPAPPALALMTALGGVLFGATGLARSAAVIGAIPLGVFGAFRFARSRGVSWGGALGGAMVYGINPAPRNAIAQGRLGPLVLFALAPFLVHLLVRAARFDVIDNQTPGRIRTVAWLAVITALATAWYPPALLVPLGVAVVWLVVAPFTRGVAASLRAVAVALVASVAALVLLMPWPLVLEHFSRDHAAFGLAFHPHLDLVDTLRFESGPAGAGVTSWGIYAAAALALLVATGPRLAWATRGWTLAAAGIAAVYVPARLFSDVAVPVPEAGLTLAALGLGIAAGVSVGTVVEEMRRARFGWRQLALVLASLGLALAAVGFVADTVDGRWHAPDRGWDEALAFTRDHAAEGQFRILWLGDASILPFDPTPLDRHPQGLAPRESSAAYVLTRNGAGDARDLWRAPIRAADDLVPRVLRLAGDGRTNRLGRLLAPMGIRYVAVPSRAGPGGVLAAPPDAVSRALDAQLDLVRLQSDPGLAIYRNDAWAPLLARISEDAGAAATAPTRDPLASAARTDLSNSVPVAGSPVESGTVLWAETYDRDWSATGRDRSLVHRHGFGWSNAFELPVSGQVSLSFGDQGTRNLIVVAVGVGWSIVALLLWFGRRRPPAVGTVDRATARERRIERRRLRREERPKLGEVLGLDDVFWER